MREGVDEHRLVRWRRVLEKAQARPKLTRTIPFVEIRRGAPAQVEVVLRSSCVLRCASDIEPSVLRRLVDALEDASTC
jgi:hypothetical protein